MTVAPQQRVLDHYPDDPADTETGDDESWPIKSALKYGTGRMGIDSWMFA